MVFFIDEAHSRTPPTNVNKKMVFLNEGFPNHTWIKNMMSGSGLPKWSQESWRAGEEGGGGMCDYQEAVICIPRT